MKLEIRKTWVISCPLNTRSGYGARSRDLVRQIIAKYGDEYNISILPQRWGNTPQNVLKPGKDDDLLSRVITNLTQQPDIWSQVTIPNEFQKLGKISIGFTAGIESTLVPGEWIEGCNRMDLVVVSSNHSKQVIESTMWEKRNQQQQVVGQVKCNVPVEVLFEGINLDVYNRQNKVEETIKQKLNKIPERFNYLFTGHWLNGDVGHDRKNVGLLIQVFYEMFAGKKKKPGLIMKLSAGTNSITDRNLILTKIKQIKEHTINRLGHDDLPNIYVIHGELTDEQMNSMYNHSKVKCHVSMTKGEGYGRPLLEATTSGKPVICSNWSGPVDFMNPDYSILIGGELENVHPSAANKWIIKESQWFRVDVNQFASAMMSVFMNYKQYEEKCRKHAHYTRTTFSMDQMGDKLKEIVDKYKDGQRPPQSIQLPKLKKVGQKTEMPKISLPKLKKVTQ